MSEPYTPPWLITYDPDDGGRRPPGPHPRAWEGFQIWIIIIRIIKWLWPGGRLQPATA